MEIIFPKPKDFPCVAQIFAIKSTLDRFIWFPFLVFVVVVKTIAFRTAQNSILLEVIMKGED